MKKPLISFIVPVYNAQKYLQRCIDSIINQSNPNFEIILVNDGSQDNSLSICQEYSQNDTRIRVINKPNGGVSSARNKGIEIAQGEYLTFVDADDYLSSEFLDNFGVEPGIDFYSQGCVNEYIDRPDYTTCHAATDRLSLSEFIESILLNGLIAPPWSKLYSLKIIKDHNLRFNEKHSYAEDRLFNVEYLQHAKSFKTIAQTGYHYTHENPSALTQNAVSGTVIMDFINLYRPILLDIMKKIELSDSAQLAGRFSYNYLLIQSIINIVKNKKFSKSRCFIESIPKDFIKDVQSQTNLPPRFKMIAKSLSFPSILTILIAKL